ncbi:glycosyltransferase family 61 protein [uncultured Marixanthomonas sp.]|uniref:glycosyltransferase family 61 protein n=1 Tax=uncultured Marixanthomonas sp. TaxID=757245 RepID=UPI0030D97273
MESTIFQTEYLNRLNSNHLVFLKGFLPKKKGANVVSLLNKLDNNYFHWTLESLTRVLLIHEEPFFRDYNILIKDGALPFVKKSLKFLFNVPETNIITKTLGEKLEVKKALVVSFPHIRNVNTRMTNVYMPSVIKRLNELAHKRVNAAKLKFERLPKNFIISRKNAISRRILNEEKLIESLSYLNFEQVVLEELSFEEQVVLFVGAKKIISSHGAGITNIIYAHDPILIEIFPEERSIRDAYYFVQITGALEIEHHLFKHKTQNKKEDMVIGNTMIATFKKIFEASI